MPLETLKSLENEIGLNPDVEKKLAKYMYLSWLWNRQYTTKEQESEMDDLQDWWNDFITSI